MLFKRSKIRKALADGDFIDDPEFTADADPFIWSLDNLTADQIAAPKPEPRKTFADRLYGLIRGLLLIVCLGVFCYSVYAIVQQLIDYRRAEILYAEAADDMDEEDMFGLVGFDFGSGDRNFSASSVLRRSNTMQKFDNTQIIAATSDQLDQALGDVQVSGYNARLEKMRSKLNAMTIKYPDTYGWIVVGGTQISYPIMQAASDVEKGKNEYYLKHAYTGEYLPAGAIFADYRNYRDIMKNWNTVIYGHNMLDGLMFNGIAYFMDEEFFKNNKYIDIYTVDGIYTYEVFSIYKARYDEGYIRTEFEDYTQFCEFVSNIWGKSMWSREGMQIGYGDRILTLSTCTNGPWYYRYALHAKLINVQN
ncbi:MAG: class B sortase [Clostridiales bacterium]|nr:class B sortase [Clostridiales bacterium]